MKKIFTLFSFLFLLSISSYGQANEEYVTTLKKMFEVAGTEQTYQVGIDQMMQIFRGQYSEMDQKIWDDIESEFSETSMNELTDMLTPIYFKHMTLEDIQGVIKFYESPVGKKFAEKTPMIVQESILVGQQWGMSIGEKIMKKMEEEGY